MKILKQEAELISFTPGALKHIETCGRTAYRSESKGEPGKFVEMLIKRGHESVLEHACASLRLTTDRGVSHELVRHRLAAYTMQSTRFVSFQQGINVIRPPGLVGEQDSVWAYAMTHAEISYKRMIELGEPPEIARSVLPTCLATEIVATMNFRQWRHVLKQRLTSAAHPSMRELMELVAVKLRGLSLEVFGEFVH